VSRWASPRRSWASRWCPAVGPEGLGGLLSARPWRTDRDRRAPHRGPATATGAVRRLLVDRTWRGAGGRCRVRGYALSYVLLVAVGALDFSADGQPSRRHADGRPGRMRGRVMGDMGAVTLGVTPLAETQSGGHAAVMGAPLPVVAALTALRVTAIAIGRSNWPLRSFARDEVTAGPSAPVAADRPTPQPPAA
jgi:hypothetical protein